MKSVVLALIKSAMVFKTSNLIFCVTNALTSIILVPHNWVLWSKRWSKVAKKANKNLLKKSLTRLSASSAASQAVLCVSNWWVYLIKHIRCSGTTDYVLSCKESTWICVKFQISKFLKDLGRLLTVKLARYANLRTRVAYNNANYALLSFIACAHGFMGVNFSQTNCIKQVYTKKFNIKLTHVW